MSERTNIRASEAKVEPDLPLTWSNLAIALAAIAASVWLSAIFPLGFGSTLP